MINRIEIRIKFWESMIERERKKKKHQRITHPYIYTTTTLQPFRYLMTIVSHSNFFIDCLCLNIHDSWEHSFIQWSLCVCVICSVVVVVVVKLQKKKNFSFSFVLMMMMQLLILLLDNISVSSYTKRSFFRKKKL